MRVLLAGASGTLGRALVPQLIAAGHDVIGLSRSAGSVERLQALGAETIVADVLDRDALLRALQGWRAEAVISEVTALRKPPTSYRAMTETNELRTVGTANLVEAAHLLGATRMLTQSIVFGYGYHSPRREAVDESQPFAVPEGAPVDPIYAALADNERAVRRATGLGGIALRYGLFYGLDGADVRAMLNRRMLPVTGWNGLIPLLHHEDAASATVAALERGIAGRAYNIADDTPVTWRRHIRTAARALAARDPLLVPAWVLRAAAPYAAELISGLDLLVSTELAHRELGWSPKYPSVEEGWAASARWLESQQD